MNPAEDLFNLIGAVLLFAVISFPFNLAAIASLTVALAIGSHDERWPTAATLPFAVPIVILLCAVAFRPEGRFNADALWRIRAIEALL